MRLRGRVASENGEIAPRNEVIFELSGVTRNPVDGLFTSEPVSEKVEVFGGEPISLGFGVSVKRNELPAVMVIEVFVSVRRKNGVFRLVVAANFKPVWSYYEVVGYSELT